LAIFFTFGTILKNYPIRLSVALALMMPLSILPIRIRQGQGGDMLDLVGSEIVISLLCLACSITIFYLLRISAPPYRWMGLALATFCCGCLSIFFYFSSNFFFEDYPEGPLRQIPFLKAVSILFYRGVVIAAIVSPIAWFFEGYRKAQEGRVDLEHLKVENLLARLNSLQQQMNPHFLLNCLNVLKSGTKEEWAKEYVLQLSKVYRYLLTLNQESHLVTVENEVQFIRSYIHVLRERFEEGLQVSIEITPAASGRYIPPMALQTLVENAIKHNSVSLASPLHIRIYDEEDHLVVENTLQRKDFEQETGTSGIGLKNLEERYRLIAGVSPVVIREEFLFIVKLPLLNDRSADPGR
jgi:hypothetical protein